MATPPTLISEGESDWDATATTKVVNITVAAGDRIVVKGATEGNACTLGTPTGGSLTYTLEKSFVGASNCAVYGWTATASGSATFDVSITSAGSVLKWGHTVEVWRNSDGIGNSSVTNSTGAPSLALTTAADNSAISTISGDWNAADGTSRTWRTINSVTPTVGNGGERVYFRNSSNYTVYGAQWPDVGAAGSKTTGLSAPSGQQYAIISIEVKGTASTATAVPAPIVIDQPPAPARRGQATVVRSTLADDPVLTTPAPMVVEPLGRRPGPPTVIVSRSSTEDTVTPAAATPQPVVATWTARRAAPPDVVIVRGSLEDLATPGPIVVGQPARPGHGGVQVLRSSTEDEPVLTTAPPVVAEPRGLRPPPPVVIVGRASTEDPPPPTTGPTTIPVVVTQPGRFGPGDALISRGSLADDPVLTTPPPVVITRPARPLPTPTVIVGRGSLVDLATPGPIVVTAPPGRPGRGIALVVRSPLADPVVVTQATPGPLVATHRFRPARRPQVLLLRGVGTDVEPEPCEVPRPFTGVITRPGSGSVGRPTSGTTTRPGAGLITRPFTGTVDRPDCDD